jgi:hypothetical protein
MKEKMNPELLYVSSPSDSPKRLKRLAKHNARAHRLALRKSRANTPFSSLLANAMGVRKTGKLERRLGFPKGVLKRLLRDDYWPNSVPVLLALDLFEELHIEGSAVVATVWESLAALPRDKRPVASLWECEEGVEKWLNRLLELEKERKARKAWMTEMQQANFLYWLGEYSNLRGLKEMSFGEEYLRKVEALREEFFRKYPGGELTGWNRAREAGGEESPLTSLGGQ